jgi:hypothetical protein
MTQQDRKPQTGASPGAVITKRALDYACSYFDFAVEKFPELKGYSPEKRSIFMQAAITVSALILMERRTGGAGRSELHESVSRSYAPSVQHRHLAAIQDLTMSLFQIDPGSLRAQDIPSFAGAAGASDGKLINSIGAWLVSSMTKKPQLSPADQKLAAAMGKNAWTSGTMIVRMLMPKEKPKSEASSPDELTPE